MKITPADLQSKMKAMAKAKGYTATEIADATGLSKNVIVNMANSFPRSDTLAKISEFLGCTMDEFFFTERNVEESEISVDERWLLDKFRELDPDGRAAVCGLALSEYRKIAEK